MTTTQSWWTKCFAFQPDFFKYRWEAMSPLSEANISCCIHCAVLKAPGLLRTGGVLRELLTFNQVLFISLHLRMRVFAIQLVLHCLAQRSWVPCQLQEDSQWWGQETWGKQQAAGRLQLPCPGQGVFLQKQSPSLAHSLRRFVRQGHTWGSAQHSLLPLLWKRSPSPWENQSAAAC